MKYEIVKPHTPLIMPQCSSSELQYTSDTLQHSIAPAQLGTAWQAQHCSGDTRLTCKLDADAHAGAHSKGHVGQPPTPVAPCLVPNPPLRLERLSVLPVSFIVLHRPQVHVHPGALGK